MIEHLLNWVVVGIMASGIISLFKWYQMSRDTYEENIKAITEIYVKGVEVLQKPLTEAPKPRGILVSGKAYVKSLVDTLKSQGKVRP